MEEPMERPRSLTRGIFVSSQGGALVDFTLIRASSSLLPVQEQRSRCSFEEGKDLKICNAYYALHMLD